MNTRTFFLNTRATWICPFVLVGFYCSTLVKTLYNDMVENTGHLQNIIFCGEQNIVPVSSCSAYFKLVCVNIWLSPSYWYEVWEYAASSTFLSPARSVMQQLLCPVWQGEHWLAFTSADWLKRLDDRYLTLICFTASVASHPLESTGWLMVGEGAVRLFSSAA